MVLDEHKEVGNKLYGEGSSLLEESSVSLIPESLNFKPMAHILVPHLRH